MVKLEVANAANVIAASLGQDVQQSIDGAFDAVVSSTEDTLCQIYDKVNKDGSIDNTYTGRNSFHSRSLPLIPHL